MIQPTLDRRVVKMRAPIKVLFYVVGFFMVLVVWYVGYLAITYIDDTKKEGKAYGFEIGTSKKQTFSDVRNLLDVHPRLVIYVSYGPRAGDNKTIKPLDSSYAEVKPHDNWVLLLNGKGEFFDFTRLYFEKGNLVKIHRHRQYFELP